jgi:menaquinone-9 beta-reductase
MIQTDVIIVGGGPAGSACARRLRQHGLDCVVLDRQPFPRAKPCAGWITPEVVRDLEIQPGEYPHGFTTFRASTLHLGRFRLSVRSHQHAIRRVEFDHWLLTRSGAPVHRHAVRSIASLGDGFVVDGAFTGRYLVGAGGTSCPVYHTLFKGEHPRPRGALIVTREEEFVHPHSSDGCLLWTWSRLPGYAWFVPKAGGFVNVGIGAAAETLRANGQDLKAHWERFTERLGRAGLVRRRAYEPSVHSYYLRHRLGAVRIGNAFIAGDAAGLATLDMGEGIGPAVRSGVLAADAIARGGEYSLDGVPKFSHGALLGTVMRAAFGLRRARDAST